MFHVSGTYIFGLHTHALHDDVMVYDVVFEQTDSVCTDRQYLYLWHSFNNGFQSLSIKSESCGICSKLGHRVHALNRSMLYLHTPCTNKGRWKLVVLLFCHTGDMILPKPSLGSHAKV